MAAALISPVLERLKSVAEEMILDGVKLFVGVDEEVESLKRTLQSIQDVVEDAEHRQVKDKSVQRWLEDLKDVAYQIDDVLDEWSASLPRLQIEPAETSASASKRRKVTDWFLSRLPNVKPVTRRSSIADKIKIIKQQLDGIDERRRKYNFSPNMIERPLHPITTSLVDFSEVCGRDMDQNTMRGHLLGEKGEQSSGLYIVSIVGTGGMGKTTLAQLAYHHSAVKAHFDERIWVCVSDPFEPDRIFRHIIEHFSKKPCRLQNLEEIRNQVEAYISGKKFLLVLDDVWTEDYRLWDQVKSTFLSGAEGSRILATTRKDTVASTMESTYKHPLGELSQQASQNLFRKIAFSNNDKAVEYKEIGDKIAYKCKGLPLAIKTIGSLMRSKNSTEEWEAILNSELWEHHAFETNISPAFLLSYYDLPPTIKRCFSFCAVFQKDKVIRRDELIHLWMAHNYLKPFGKKEMEMIGREYFEHLAAASFFQDFKKDGDGNIIECKMHDILHDFAQLLTNGEFLSIESGQQSQRHMRNSRHATFIIRSNVSITTSVSSMKQLHTLLVSNPIKCDSASLPFQHFKYLRALSLRSSLWLEELPNEVGELIHLRYLDLNTCTELEELPETICNLHNLQTLDIRRCDELWRLPYAIDKLTNLRHLKNSGGTCRWGLPKGIVRLNSLQTLWYFVVRRGDLRHLNKLRGGLSIGWLNKVEDAREVEEAELEKKIHIQTLELRFGRGKTTKDVAEAIKLPPKLKDLTLWYYEEAEFPGWMMRPSSLAHLRRLSLKRFSECSSLPPLGELPALERLHIESMNRVKCVGDEFVGSSSSSSSSIAFPKLKHLSFEFINNWEKWEVKEDRQRSAMPSLQVLKMRNCPDLAVLPGLLLQRTELHHLWSIVGCPALKRHYQNVFPNL